MNEFVKTLLNIRSLRAIARELTIQQLDEALEKLISVVEEKRKEQAAISAANEAKRNKLNEYKELLAAEGISPEELLGLVPGSTEKAKRTPRAPKYKYLDSNNIEQTWTGQGRQPKPIADAIRSGEKRLEDFLI